MKSCEWDEDEDGNWWTWCGHVFCLTDGTPTENGMEFCCYCGGGLVEERLSYPMEPNDDDTEYLR